MKTTLSLKDFALYRGFDASRRISLFEYGFLYSYEDPRSKGDLRVWVVHPGYRVLDWADFARALDFWKEFNWIRDDKREGFLSFLGLTLEEFNAEPLERKIYDAIGYFGPEEICGTPYHGTPLAEFEGWEDSED
jgi:hypothetical protein